MQFEERELKPYAEPVSGSELNEGEVYFSVNFADEAMLLPVMEPVVFIGRDLDNGDNGKVYFQDVDSYRKGVRYNSQRTDLTDEPAIFQSGSENEVSHIFEYERALDVLLACSLRRRKNR